MDDESGESMEPMEEVQLKELGESESERLVRGRELHGDGDHGFPAVTAVTLR